MLGTETAEKRLEDVTSTRLLGRGLGDQAWSGGNDEALGTGCLGPQAPTRPYPF